MAVRRIDDLVGGDVQPGLLGRGPDLLGGADQDRHDDAGLGRFDRPAQRRLVAGMRHRGWDRRVFAGQGDQAFVLVMAAGR